MVNTALNTIINDKKHVTTLNIKVFSVHPDKSIWRWYQSKCMCINSHSMVRGLIGIRLHENSAGASASTAKICSSRKSEKRRIRNVLLIFTGYDHYRSISIWLHKFQALLL